MKKLIILVNTIILLKIVKNEQIAKMLNMPYLAEIIAFFFIMFIFDITLKNLSKNLKKLTKKLEPGKYWINYFVGWLVILDIATLVVILLTICKIIFNLLI